jgi:hypothetical protein
MSSELQSSLINGTLVATYKFDEILVRKNLESLFKKFCPLCPNFATSTYNNRTET